MHQHTYACAHKYKTEVVVVVVVKEEEKEKNTEGGTYESCDAEANSNSPASVVVNAKLLTQS